MLTASHLLKSVSREGLYIIICKHSSGAISVQYLYFIICSWDQNTAGKVLLTGGNGMTYCQKHSFALWIPALAGPLTSTMTLGNYFCL